MRCEACCEQRCEVWYLSCFTIEVVVRIGSGLFAMNADHGADAMDLNALETLLEDGKDDSIPSRNELKIMLAAI